MRIYLPEKREKKGLKWLFNKPPIPFSDWPKLATESLFVSPTWSPPISFCCRQSRGWTARCWNICYLAAFWQAIEVGQVSRSQVVGFLKHQQLGDETLLKLVMGNCDESWRVGWKCLPETDWNPRYWNPCWKTTDLTWTGRFLYASLMIEFEGNARRWCYVAWWWFGLFSENPNELDFFC